MKQTDFKWTKGCDMGFVVGQRVWSVKFGWGIITSISPDSTYPIRFISNKGETTTFQLDGKIDADDEHPSLFHKEQTFDFSKPEWQPKEGELVWVWGKENKYPFIQTFKEMKGEKFITESIVGDWTNCAPFNNGQLPEQFKHLLEGEEK